jgi:hypothetical protein
MLVSTSIKIFGDVHSKVGSPEALMGGFIVRVVQRLVTIPWQPGPE